MSRQRGGCLTFSTTLLTTAEGRASLTPICRLNDKPWRRLLSGLSDVSMGPRRLFLGPLGPTA